MMATMNDNRQNGRSLPDGWELKTVGDVVTFEYGKGLTQNKRDSSGKVPVYGSNGIVGYHSSALIDKPCLIVGRKGAAGAVHKSEIPCWAIDTTYYVIPPENANLSFLYYLFSSLDFPSLDRSTAIPGLNRNDAYAVEIPFPPLPEQEKIVSRIEELFSDLDAGAVALERVRVGLKRYKASVLKAAVEGKLLEKRSELSEEWRFVKLGSVFQVKIGKTPSRSKPEFWNGDIHWVSSGEVINSRIKETREKITEQGLGNTKLYPIGTVLLAT